MPVSCSPRTYQFVIGGFLRLSWTIYVDFYSSYLHLDALNKMIKLKARILCKLQYKTPLEGVEVWLNLVFVGVNFDVDCNKNEL